MDESKAVKNLSEIVGAANVRASSSERGLYSVDGVAPQLVLFPGGIEEVSQVMDRAAREKRAVIPWGSGTKMGWGRIPSRVDWVVSTSRLNRITECDHENLTVSVEPGAALVKVQELLKGSARGYFIPLDPPFSQKATVGGIVATRSSGPKRHFYGTPRDLILALKVILPNGMENVWGRKTVKNVAGYDMAKVYIGSFGTLGIISEVTFRILPLPERETTLVATFETALNAFEGVSKIVQSELLPSAVEVLNSKGIEMLGLPATEKKESIALAVDFEGFDESVHRQITQVKEMIGSSRPVSIHVLEGTRQEAFWTGLRDFESTARLSYPDSTSCKVRVPVSKAAEVFALLEEITEGMGLQGGLRCHAGSGVVDMDFLSEDLKPRIDDFARALIELREKISALDGSMVMNRAPLSLKRRIDVWGPPGKDFVLMQSLKAKFDPDGLLNPGRFLGGI